MYVKVGSNSLDSNRVEMTNFSTRSIMNARGTIERQVKRLEVTGVLLASTQSAIDSAISTLNGYIAGGVDVALHRDDTTITQHVLDHSSSLGGVHLLELSFPGGQGEFATKRTWRAVWEASYSVSLASGTIITHNETLQHIGTGGARKVIIETITGSPIEQTVNLYTTTRAVQAGTSVGWGAYPSYPSYIFSSANLVLQNLVKTPGTPQLVDGAYVYYPISWVYPYQFTSAPSYSTPVAV